jgi:hypothetical protein
MAVAPLEFETIVGSGLWPFFVPGDAIAAGTAMQCDDIKSTSWPGLSRPSTSCFFAKEGVDARHKAGHDGGEGLR